MPGQKRVFALDVPGIHVFGTKEGSRGWPGHGSPAFAGDDSFSRGRQLYFFNLAIATPSRAS